ncbi:hypothetical protein ACOME3_003856 [Neoechinorhynchus agilis]
MKSYDRNEYLIKRILNPSDFYVVRKDLIDYSVEPDCCTNIIDHAVLPIGAIVGCSMSDGRVKRARVIGVIGEESPQISLELADTSEMIGVIDINRISRIPVSEKKNLGATHVSLHGIKPLSMKMDNLTVKVELKESHEWSLIAIRAFRSLIEESCEVKVAFVGLHKVRLTIVRDYGRRIDVAEYLCERKFAVKTETEHVDLNVIEDEGYGNPSGEDDIDNRKVLNFRLNEYVKIVDITDNLSVDELEAARPSGRRFHLDVSIASKAYLLRPPQQSAVLTRMGLLLMRGFSNLHVIHRNVHDFFIESTKFALSVGKSCFVCSSVDQCTILNDWLRNKFEFRHRCFVVNSQTVLKAHERSLKSGSFNLLIAVPTVVAECVKQWEIIFRTLIIIDTNCLIDEYKSSADQMFRYIGHMDCVANDLFRDATPDDKTTTIIVHSREYYEAHERQIYQWLFPSQLKTLKMRNRSISDKQLQIKGPMLTLFGSAMSAELRSQRMAIIPHFIQSIDRLEELKILLGAAIADPRSGILVVCTSLSSKILVTNAIRKEFGVLIGIAVYGKSF